MYCLLILLLFAALCRWYGDAGCYLYGNEVPVCVIWWGGGGDSVYCLLILLLFAALCRWYGDAGCYLYGNEVPVCVIWWGGGVTLCTI